MHITKSIHPQKKVLSVFSLVMINVIAVDSLRSLAISAEFGLALVFYYVVGALIFFIPIALVAAELATGWPKIGGLYVWVREAFGRRWGLVAIWLQWIYNVVWFPTILAFIAATLAFLIDPELAHSSTYMLIVVLTTFWLATLLNCFGMELSGLVSTIGAVVGTIFPMLLIICLSIFWLLQGNTPQIEFSMDALIPKVDTFNEMAFFVAVLFSLLGIEMSAVHAEDVKNPRKDYPKALLISTIIILFSLIGASLAIAIVIPHDDISLVAGLLDAFKIFFDTFHISWMVPVIAVLIIIGSIGGLSAWIIGPTKGLLAAADDNCLPEIFKYTNKYGAPVALLIMQGIIFTVLCSIFLLMPTVNSSYWILSVLTAQLAMLVYLFMFAAAIKLRCSQKDVKRTYKVPLGNAGMWMAGVIGSVAALFAIIIGFFPPPEVQVDNLFWFEAFLIGGIVIFTVAPLFLYKASRK